MAQRRIGIARRSAQPIASSASGGLQQAGTRCPRDEISPPTILGLGQALSLASPPTEAGERCHVCDSEAVRRENHVAWCRDCATALFMDRGVKVQGAYPKVTTSGHALKRAFRWRWLAGKLLVRQATVHLSL